MSSSEASLRDKQIVDPGPAHPVGGYAYPADLVQFVRERWSSVPTPDGDDHPALPDAVTLEDFLSASYQAGMLREEERPVTFRAILAPPARFPEKGRPPDRLQRLEFARSLPFDPRELRRLSAVADPRRTLIGVQGDTDQGLRVWGLIHSGDRWLRHVQGGRQEGPPLPAAPVVHVDAPGSIAVHRGYELVGKLHGGRLSGARMDLFKAQWLPDEFASFRQTLMERHRADRDRLQQLTGETWARLEPTIQVRITERMMKRVIAIVRRSSHGGIVAFIPAQNGVEPSRWATYIDLKYRFAPGLPQPSFSDLIVGILNRLARLHGTGSGQQPRTVGWKEFETATDAQIDAFDEALFNVAHLIADLAAADGAVVLSKHYRPIGFGGMISGRLPAAYSVARALDLEGEKVIEEETLNVGARHRAAYRLVAALPGTVVVVISEDGGVRFVTHKHGRVTYWEQE